VKWRALTPDVRAAQSRAPDEGKQMTLSDRDKQMIRHASGDLNGAAVTNLQNAVAARLQADLDAGLIKAVTRNHVRAAVTKELSRGK